jgi:hypothetical protein
MNPNSGGILNMMTRAKIGMAVAVGLGLSLGGTASAQLESNFDLQSAVSSLSDTLGFVVGSTGNQKPGSNPELPCPGEVEGGDEDIYDFDQDGIPDYAQMALIEALYNANNAQVVFAIDRMANGLKTVPIALPVNSFGPEGCTQADEGCICLDPISPGNFICGEQLRNILIALVGNSQTNTLPPVPQLLLDPLIAGLLLDDLDIDCNVDPAACAALIAQAVDALTVFGAINNPGNFQSTACIDPIVGLVVGLLIPTYAPASESDLSGVVNGSVVLDDDDTVLDKWLEASGGKTSAVDDPAFLATVDEFVALVLEAMGEDNGNGGTPVGGANNPFPSAPAGTPVAAPIGLALLAAGLGFAAIRRNRRA